MTALNQAEQQLRGFIHAKKGYDLNSLIQSMGLTKTEWQSMKRIYKLNFMLPVEIKKIDEHFKNQKL